MEEETMKEVVNSAKRNNGVINWIRVAREIFKKFPEIEHSKFGNIILYRKNILPTDPNIIWDKLPMNSAIFDFISDKYN